MSFVAQKLMAVGGAFDPLEHTVYFTNIYIHTVLKFW